jgi:hypothetical protein
MEILNSKVQSDVIHDHMILSGCSINNNTMSIRCLQDIADDTNLKSLCIDLFAVLTIFNFQILQKVTSLRVSPVKERQKKWPQNDFSPYTSKFGA